MKLERLSENQIRCTLNKTDLADHELMLNELAYGTDKAKELFQEIMEQAADELGFEVDDLRLMIEAIPISPECLILIITKVDDPEELDTRFSRFSKYTENIETEEDIDSSQDESFDLFDSATSLMETISDIVENIQLAKQNGVIGRKEKPTEDTTPFKPLKETSAVEKAEGKIKKAEDTNYRIFSFTNINELSKAASMVVGIYEDESVLYKSPLNNHYYLLVGCEGNNTDNYQRVCNCLSEYGSKVKSNYATPFYFFEHFKIIIQEKAIETLARL